MILRKWSNFILSIEVDMDRREQEEGPKQIRSAWSIISEALIDV